MKVHFIGAGPGAADLITVRGLNLIRSSPIILYAGSLVPAEVIEEAGEDARIVDTSALDLEMIVGEFRAARKAGRDVARVHSGDPSLYGAIAEQMRRLDQLKIEYDITPGVPSYAAAAAAIKAELTLPGVCQTIILTRTSTKSSAMPKGEDLKTLAASGATMAIHLSINNMAGVVRDLTPFYGANCPVVVAYRISWPDQQIIRGELQDIRGKVKASGITRTALILVGQALGNRDFDDSRLYDAAHGHLLRP